ncbi:flagellar hook-associated protein FlgK [Ferrimonas balearica]|uniref:flagellar hook-associated protein FlgK n=1 Tax=Ferrimonas balearica TaxID=44012 RepID=UPI001C990727|nr:flagellar hook-associated protein FlgK [Ferrimonas balearica]MBY5920025.1 flagellar hook-associated protein FlgK [Ferrimonas balearica]MBY5997290.1 flagellar hook-associated protein FlgK [Ferrimonas balearica]
MNMLGNGLSGLHAAQMHLAITSNNIANATTPGYSRQQLLVSARPGGFMGAGSGVQVDGVRRVADEYLTAQIWRASTQAGFSNTKASYLGKTEEVFGSKGASISMGLDSLFAALNSAMESPNDIATRQSVMNEAKALASRFTTINQSLDSQLKQIEEQIKGSVTEVNTRLENIARINKEIQSNMGSGDVPPQLLDARDQAVAELAEMVDIRTTENADGTINVTLPKGQPLVLGTSPAKFEAYPDPNNPQFSALSLSIGGTTYQINDEVGGKMGALFEYRDTNWQQSRDFIDELAMQMADGFNAILANGTDLNGNAPTLDLFTYDPANPAGTLKVTDGFTAEMLAFGKNGAPGDNTNLKDLLAFADTKLTFTSLGSDATLNEAYAMYLGELGIQSRQAQLESDSADGELLRALNERDGVSAVNLDEEGVNIIVYQQAYQANAKVISTADQLFQTMLTMF